MLFVTEKLILRDGVLHIFHTAVCATTIIDSVAKIMWLVEEWCAMTEQTINKLQWISVTLPNTEHCTTFGLMYSQYFKTLACTISSSAICIRELRFHSICIQK